MPLVSERIAIADARREIPAALDRFEGRCRAAGFAEPTVLELRVIAEEVLTNIAKYGYEPGERPAVEMSFSFSGDGAIVEFRDQGRPFDPLAEPGPDLDAPVEQRAVGGLGLTLVRALVEEVQYVRDGPTNVLRIVKRRAAP